MTVGDRIIERVRAASLEELASGAFLVPGDETAEPGDAARVSEAILSALSQKNQFAASEPKVVAGVERTIAALFSSLGRIERGGKREEAFATAAVSIAQILGTVLGPQPREVTSATYSPELQLRILGLSAEGMRPPILDVGCGSDAALVRFLRELKRNAFGIDREAPADFCERADWLTYDYGVSHWGTIVSHLGFSLHFMHQEMKSSELAFDYAKTYMRVLKSLAPGGTFAYVPGLPFIEPMLPASDFTVKRVSLAPELFTENVARVQEATGLVLQAATHVTRRSAADPRT